MTTRAYGDGLRRILKNAGIAQRDLADAIGVTRQTMNAYVTPDMNRRKTPSEERKRQISEYLGMSESEIIKAGHGKGEEPRRYEHNATAAKTGQENARRAFATRLADHGNEFLRGLRRTVEAPGFEPVRFDYVDNNMALQLVYRSNRPSALYEALWSLFKTREVTRRVGVDRRVVLAVVDSPGVVDDYAADAELAGVDLIEFDTPEQLADWVASQTLEPQN